METNEQTTTPAAPVFKRRWRVFTLGGSPHDVANNGYVADLIHAVRLAAESHGAAVAIIKKNSDRYITVQIPNADEVVAIDQGAQ